MRILIVDDSNAMRMIMKKTLRKAGFGSARFAEASDGVDALTKLSGVDLVLTDWNMPNMDGEELLQALEERSFDGQRGVVSSAASSAMKSSARSAGASFVISKPFSAANFREAIESAGFQAESVATDADLGLRQTFDVRGVRDTLSSAIARPVDVHPVPELDLNRNQRWLVAQYVNAEGEERACLAMPRATAANLGSAMVMLPTSIANRLGRRGRLPEHLHDNIREMCNLFCQMLGDREALRLVKVDFQCNYVPFSALVGTLSGSRLDVSIEISGHPTSPMTLIRYGAR